MSCTHNHTKTDDPPPYDLCNNTTANQEPNSLSNHLKVPDHTLNNALSYEQIDDDLYINLEKILVIFLVFMLFITIIVLITTIPQEYCIPQKNETNSSLTHLHYLKTNRN